MQAGPDAMRRYRNALDMSQDALAKRVDVTSGYISQIERGINHPSREVVERLDAALEAGGELLSAFGYVATGSLPAGRLDALEVAVRGLAQALSYALEAGQIRLEAEHIVLLEAAAQLHAPPSRVEPPTG